MCWRSFFLGSRPVVVLWNRVVRWEATSLRRVWGFDWDLYAFSALVRSSDGEKSDVYALISSGEGWAGEIGWPESSWYQACMPWRRFPAIARCVVWRVVSPVAR